MAHPPNIARLDFQIDGKLDSDGRGCHAADPPIAACSNMETNGTTKTLLKGAATWRILPILPVGIFRMMENWTVLEGAVTRRILPILPV